MPSPEQRPDHPVNRYAITPPNPVRAEWHERDLPRPPLASRTYGADVSYRARSDVWAPTDHTFAWVEEPGEDGDASTPPRRAALPIYLLHGEGHSWGYPGSGPAQLALDILLDALDEWPERRALNRGDSLAYLMHQDLKTEVIARLDQHTGWRLPGVTVAEWIGRWQERDLRRYDEFRLTLRESAPL